MKVSYFPGCTLKNKAKDLDEYAYRSAEALGVTWEEIEHWQCCGGVFTTSQDEVATKLSSVRALKYAADREQPLVTVCSACHNVIKQTNHAMQENKEFAAKVKYLVLIGETAEKIDLCAKQHGFYSIVHMDTLEEAVEFCYRNARPGDAVLLSPACASWDMFESYEQRGNLFKEYVRNLEE